MCCSQPRCGSRLYKLTLRYIGGYLTDLFVWDIRNSGAPSGPNRAPRRRGLQQQLTKSLSVQLRFVLLVRSTLGLFDGLSLLCHGRLALGPEVRFPGNWNPLIYFPEARFWIISGLPNSSEVGFWEVSRVPQSCETVEKLGYQFEFSCWW
jgi:hypothetical protein